MKYDALYKFTMEHLISDDTNDVMHNIFPRFISLIWMILL